MEWFSNLLNIRCPFCGEALARPQTACRKCAQKLAELEGTPGVFFGLNGLPVVAGSIYEDWTRSLLLRQKRHSTRPALKWLARCLRAKMPLQWREMPLAWIPGSLLKPPHLVDQVVAELAVLGQPLCGRRVLARRFWTGRPQKSLSLKERGTRDIRSLYRSINLPRNRARKESVILFDDIITTGVTVTGCAKILKEDLGIETKGVLALAYTPRLR